MWSRVRRLGPPLRLTKRPALGSLEAPYPRTADISILHGLIPPMKRKRCSAVCHNGFAVSHASETVHRGWGLKPKLQALIPKPYCRTSTWCSGVRHMPWRATCRGNGYSGWNAAPVVLAGAFSGSPAPEHVGVNHHRLHFLFCWDGRVAMHLHWLVRHGVRQTPQKQLVR